MKPDRLVERIHQLDRRLEQARLDQADLADQRGNAISELLHIVGGTEAAELLGISRTALYRAARR